MAKESKTIIITISEGKERTKINIKTFGLTLNAEILGYLSMAQDNINRYTRKPGKKNKAV